MDTCTCNETHNNEFLPSLAADSPLVLVHNQNKSCIDTSFNSTCSPITQEWVIPMIAIPWILLILIINSLLVYIISSKGAVGYSYAYMLYYF